MKSLLGEQQFAKCNFCLNWSKIQSKHYDAVANLYICSGCFDRCRKTSQFKVVQPKTMNVYDVRLRKCMTSQMDAVSKSRCGDLIQVLDRLEKEQVQDDDIQSIKQFLMDIEEFEESINKHLEPLKEFAGEIYKNEVNRVQRLWETVLTQFDQIYKSLQDYRVNTSNSLINSRPPKPDQKSLKQIKEHISDNLKNYNLAQLKKLFSESPQLFFKNDFKMAKILAKIPQSLYLACLEEIAPLTERNRTKIQQSQYFFTANNVKSASKTNRREDKQNGLPETRQVSIFAAKSPRDSKSRVKPKKRQESVGSQSERREQTKCQIKEILKNKPSLQNYKPKSDRPESSKPLYADMVMKQTIFQALEKTFIGNHMVELVSYNTQNLQFQCYLEMIKWNSQIEVVKFVKVGLTDDHLNILLSYIKKANNTTTLVLTNNLLTDNCLEILCNYFSEQKPIKNIYLCHNYIHVLRSRLLIQELKNRAINIIV